MTTAQNVLDCSSMSKNTLTPTQHISNLAAALGHFKPDLVNEGTEEEKWTGIYVGDGGEPTSQQLINICFGAMQGIKFFMKQHDEIKRNHANLVADAMQAYAIFKGEKLNPGSLAEGAETLVGQKHQMFDVLDKILTQGDVEAIHEIIEKFKTRRAKPIDRQPGKPNNGTPNASENTGEQVEGTQNVIPFNGSVETREPNA